MRRFLLLTMVLLTLGILGGLGRPGIPSRPKRVRTEGSPTFIFASPAIAANATWMLNLRTNTEYGGAIVKYLPLDFIEISNDQAEDIEVTLNGDQVYRVLGNSARTIEREFAQVQVLNTSANAIAAGGIRLLMERVPTTEGHRAAEEDSQMKGEYVALALVGGVAAYSLLSRPSAPSVPGVGAPMSRIGLGDILPGLQLPRPPNPVIIEVIREALPSVSERIPYPRPMPLPVPTVDLGGIPGSLQDVPDLVAESNARIPGLPFGSDVVDPFLEGIEGMGDAIRQRIPGLTFGANAVDPFLEGIEGMGDAIRQRIPGLTFGANAVDPFREGVQRVGNALRQGLDFSKVGPDLVDPWLEEARALGGAVVDNLKPGGLLGFALDVTGALGDLWKWNPIVVTPPFASHLLLAAKRNLP